MLSIIIVNFHAAPLIIDCLNTFQGFNQDLESEIIVVDNQANDEGRDLVTAAFPRVQWIHMNYNSGFARANNEGIRRSKGDVILLLNPDTLSVDDSITRCYGNLLSSSFIAAGVQQYDLNNQPQISGNYFVKGGLNHLLPLPYWGHLIRWLGYKAGSKVPNVREASAIQEVDWISGAFLMVKKEAIDKAGLMDEDFFLYAEEVEWCSRLKKTGPLCIFGDLRIIHLEGAAINRETGTSQSGYYNLFDKKGLQLMVSNHLRVRKQYGNGWFLFLLFNYTWGILFFLVASTIHHLFTLRNPFTDWHKVTSFAGNVFKLWSLAPRIMAGRRFFYKMF